MNLEDLIESSDFEHLADIHRRIVQMDFNVQPPQRCQQPQHAAGNEAHARQVEREDFAVVLLDQGNNLGPAFGQIDLVEDFRPPEPDDSQWAGFLNAQ